MRPIRDENPTLTTPVVTWLLILVNIGCFLYEMSLPADAIEGFVGTWGLVPASFWDLRGRTLAELVAHSLRPCFSSMFLHGGWLHLIANLWCLWLFGDNVEDHMGHVRYLGFYLAAGMLAGLLHVALNSASVVPTIGASGAIAGVMGAYFLLFPFARVTVLVPFLIFPIFIKIPAAFYLLVWIVSQVIGGYGALAQGETAVGGIAFWAHVGGFVAGMFLARRWRRKRRTPAYP